VRRTALPMRDSAAARAALPRLARPPRAGDPSAAGDGSAHVVESGVN
jgi:hypothetical protein